MPERATGFTLVEILVVLIIVGLLAGVGLPRLVAMYAAIERSGQRSAIQEQIEGLGYRAYANGQLLVLDSSGTQHTAAPQKSDLVQLPAGWSLTLPAPLRYSPQGICNGGQVTINAPDGSKEAFLLKPPLCRLAPLAAD